MSRSTSPSAWLLQLIAALCLLIGSVPAQGTETPRTRPEKPAVRDEGEPAVRPPAPGGAQDKTITEPEDPSELKGTFQVNGRTVEVTEGRFYRTYLLLKVNQPRPNAGARMEQLVLEHLMLVELAREMGCMPTEAELDLIDPLKRSSDPSLKKALMERYEKAGLTPEDVRRYAAEATAVQRFKNLHANSVRVLSQDAYDAWKRTHHLFRIGYVEFCASDYEAALRKDPPDDSTLKRFFEDNTQVRNKLRRPTSLTADVLRFDPSKLPEEELARLRADEVPYETALSYFRDNQDRLMSQVPSDRRHELHPPEGTPLEDIVTPFEVLRPQIELEILLRPRIQETFEEAREAMPDWDAEAAAKRHGLEHIHLQDVTQQDVAEALPGLGTRLYNQMWNTQIGSCSPGVQYSDGTFYFWCLRDKQISRLPTFKEAMEKGLLQEYYTWHSYALAEKEAKAFMKRIDAAISSRTSEKEKAIDEEYEKKAEQEIERRGYTEQQQKDATRARYKALAANEKRELRNRYRGKAFQKALEESGVEMKELGPFERRTGYVARQEIEDPERRKRIFLKSYYALQQMQPGDVHDKLLSDTASRCHFVLKLLDKVGPPFEEMSAEEFYQHRTRLRRQQGFSGGFNWSYQKLRKDLNWKDA